MTKTKMTQVFEYINKTNKCTHKMLITFICNMNNKTYSSGYYGTNLAVMKRKKHIKTDSNGYYKLTKRGKKNINNPYKQTLQEIKDISYYNGYYDGKNSQNEYIPKNINYVSNKECLEAIDYLFTNGYTQEMTRDKKHYTEILLKKVANCYNIELVNIDKRER